MMRGKWHKLVHRRFHANIREKFFTMRVLENWTRLPREIVESLSLEAFKAHLLSHHIPTESQLAESQTKCFHKQDLLSLMISK